MKKALVLYTGFFLVALVAFLYIGSYGPAWLRDFEEQALVLLITLFGSLLIYVDFREKRSRGVISKALAVLWAINVALAASLFAVGFAAPSALLLPVFMLEGALLYNWLENASGSVSSANPVRE